MRYDAVLFDLDGTLVDSLPDIAATANRALAWYGLPPLRQEEVKGFVGWGVRHLVEGCFAGRVADVEEAIRVFRRFYVEHPCERTTVYRGVRETLDALAGVPFGVVTNKPQAVSEAVLAALDLSRRFALVVGGDALPQRKPDPAPVEHAMRRLGVAPDRTLFVGDGVPDLQAARGARVDVCLVAWGYGSPSELQAAGPDYFVEGFGELLSIVRGGRPTSP
jgi:phosphoglycolate phosphatase